MSFDRVDEGARDVRVNEAARRAFSVASGRVRCVRGIGGDAIRASVEASPSEVLGSAFGETGQLRQALGAQVKASMNVGSGDIRGQRCNV